jgi:RNA polymerase sigma factor (sigma-70 family)
VRRSYHRIRRDIKREDSLEGAEATNLTGQQLTPQQLLIHRENKEQLEKIIGNLSVDYATIIELRGVKELSFAEVAEAMGRSVNAVTKLWQRALVRLAEEMENQG